MMMNETLNVIGSRRSIRSYRTEQIKDAELEAILNAAIYAPSGMNQQRWHFTVVQNPAMFAQMKEILRENMLNSGIPFLAERAAAPDFTAFFNAPTLVIITAEEERARLECGMAAENMMLAAESLNIGSCVMGSSELLFQSERGAALKAELGIPAGFSHVCGVTLGYKNETPEVKPRREGVINYVR